MSVESFVFLNDEKLPAIADLQAALDASGTELRLPEGVDLRSHIGYLSVQHQGQESGFEWYFGTVEATFGAGDPLAGQHAFTHVANLVTHSDLRELVCSMLTAIELAKMSGGVVFDAETGEAVSCASFHRQAMEAMAYIARSTKRNRR
jgi:hypothetical protein